MLLILDRVITSLPRLLRLTNSLRRPLLLTHLHRPGFIKVKLELAVST
jgi:hypothetical protein